VPIAVFALAVQKYQQTAFIHYLRPCDEAFCEIVEEYVPIPGGACRIGLVAKGAHHGGSDAEASQCFDGDCRSA
jgi:hypothetical protein